MQYNGNDLILMIKKAALDVIVANKLLTDGIYGVVETINPLSIRISQQSLLIEGQLTLTRNVSNYSIELAESELGTRTYTVNNALTIGEKVLILKCQQAKYIILDRVVS
jgi:hypothetical protein